MHLMKMIQLAATVITAFSSVALSLLAIIASYVRNMNKTMNSILNKQIEHETIINELKVDTGNLSEKTDTNIKDIARLKGYLYKYDSKNEL